MYVFMYVCIYLFVVVPVLSREDVGRKHVKISSDDDAYALLNVTLEYSTALYYYASHVELDSYGAVHVLLTVSPFFNIIKI